MPESPYSDFVFDKYCTLRNYIRKANLINSLYAVWAHTNYLQFNDFRLPSLIKNAPQQYQNNKGRQTFIKYGVSEWELEIVARELLIHGSLFQYRKDFCDWNHLAGALNKLKSLEDNIAGHFINNTNILLEFKRISHRQFPWQTIPNTQKMIRYWQIFSQLDEYFEEVYGVPFTHFYVVCLALFGIFSRRFMMDYPPQFDLGVVNQSTLDRVLRFIASDYNTISSILKSELSMYHDYVYKYHSLTAYPLILTEYKGKVKLICPLPTFLFNRVTDGIYYDLVNDRNLRADEIRNKIGSSFQNYIGEFIQRATQSHIQVSPEERYGSSHHPKDTADWFLVDSNNDAILVECKAKRLTISAKSELDDEGALDRDLRVLAKAVKQLYKSLVDYKNGEYPSSFPETETQYLMVCTLEEWYVFGDVINEKLLGFVREELEDSQIDSIILEQNPYFIASSSTTERIANLLRENTIRELLEGFFADDEKRTWHIDSYISNNYSEDNFINPFESEFDDFVENELISVCQSR